MTNQKMTEIISEFCEWNIRAVSAGIIIDEKATEKSGGKAIYFTYPEAYADDCRTITDEYEDAVYIEGLEGLSGNPKDTSVSILNEYILYTAAIRLLDYMKEVDDDEVDEYIAYMKKELSETIESAIKIYGKPRVGEIWTKEMMIKAIEETNESTVKALEGLRDFAGYEKLN